MRKLAAFAPAFVLLLGCMALWRAHEQRAVPLAGSLTSVLATVPGYTAEDVTLSDEERRVAGMSSYIARVYMQDTSLAFTTLVSYYERQSQGSTIHSPRNCLPGAGWEIVQGGTQVVSVAGVPHEVNRYVLRHGAESALAYYWYQGRGRVVANEYRVKWNLLRDAAVRGHTEEALVRVVVPIPTSPDTAATAGATANADRLGATISARLMQDVDRVLPARGA